MKVPPKKVFLIQAWCDQPDTRVDAGAEIHESIAVWTRKPTKQEEASLLSTFLKDKDEEDNDLGWAITVETLPFVVKK